uniref:AlNc14C150G7519 protein n=1 Tax=Albugo laibachii Nc14 TaxID=890382 RepID=F0WM06_9STRA|nr:AlNc14C150G7519 [Albugo laibachii Nc14]|eukprot:CCA22333.1 AlNc14C150G7519 [Albugo laibachii Nc14]
MIGNMTCLHSIFLEVYFYVYEQLTDCDGITACSLQLEIIRVLQMGLLSPPSVLARDMHALRGSGIILLYLCSFVSASSILPNANGNASLMVVPLPPSKSSIPNA